MTKHADLALFLNLEVCFPLLFKLFVDLLRCLHKSFPELVTVLPYVLRHLLLDVAQSCQAFSTALHNLFVEFLASGNKLAWLANMKFDFVDKVSGRTHYYSKIVVSKLIIQPSSAISTKSTVSESELVISWMSS